MYMMTAAACEEGPMAFSIDFPRLKKNYLGPARTLLEGRARGGRHDVRDAAGSVYTGVTHRRPGFSSCARTHMHHRTRSASARERLACGELGDQSLTHPAPCSQTTETLSARSSLAPPLSAEKVVQLGGVVETQRSGGTHAHQASPCTVIVDGEKWTGKLFLSSGRDSNFVCVA